MSQQCRQCTLRPLRRLPTRTCRGTKLGPRMLDRIRPGHVMCPPHCSLILHYCSPVQPASSDTPSLSSYYLQSIHLSHPCLIYAPNLSTSPSASPAISRLIDLTQPHSNAQFHHSCEGFTLSVRRSTPPCLFPSPITFSPAHADASHHARRAPVEVEYVPAMQAVHTEATEAPANRFSAEK